MIKRLVLSTTACATLALVSLPAAACPGKGVGFAGPPTSTRVTVVATADGFAIAAKTDTPKAEARPSVPLGGQTRIDLAAFECSMGRVASARR
jgi:hypothetical protein